MKTPHTQAEVDALMAATFFQGRPARSKAYREGVRAMLEHRLMAGHIFTPPAYRGGSCELDAYFAGQNEGRDIAARINNEQKGPP